MIDFGFSQGRSKIFMLTKAIANKLQYSIQEIFFCILLSRVSWGAGTFEIWVLSDAIVWECTVTE